MPSGKANFRVFPKANFEGFDFERPRNLKELIPVRSMEVRLTDAEPQYMMKQGYDDVRRCLKSPLHIPLDLDDPYCADLLQTTNTSAGIP